MERLLGSQRELYNAALEERRGAWRWERRSVTRYEQHGHLTGWAHPVLEFGVVPARGTLARLDRAFQGFYRRVRAGQTAGFPRFKGAGPVRLGRIPRPRLLEDRPNRLNLKGAGRVWFRTSRRGIPGTPQDDDVAPRGAPLAGHRVLRGPRRRTPPPHRLRRKARRQRRDTTIASPGASSTATT